MARKEKKYHFIYKTTNILSGRYYIGMHSTDNLDDGYLGSGDRLRLAVRKHGKENFEREILEFVNSRVDLRNRESEIITLDEIAKVDCMNLVVGGGGFMLDEFHYKCAKAGGNVHAEKMKTDEIYCERVIKTVTDNLKKAHQEGKIKYDTFTGKKHSEKTKEKMSNKAKLRTGDKNSQYGSCWITNGKESKKIMRGDDIPEGWYLGRKMK